MPATKNVFVSKFANSNDAFIPEVWAAEALRILYENRVASQLVHTDFSDEIAQFGDVVNTRRPAKFSNVRKTDDDEVTTQSATAQNVQVALDQWNHVSFIIKDGEESKSMQSLVDTYLRPAIVAVAQAMDQMVLGQRFEFIQNVVGSLSTTADKAGVIAVGTKLDELLCPMDSRNLIVSPSVQGDLLNIADFVSADKVGDDGTALREGSLGRKFGLQTFMTQNCRKIVATDTRTGAINNSAGYAIGETDIAVDGFSAAITTGSWITVAGDMTPQLVIGTTGGTTPSAIEIWPGLTKAVVNNAVVTVYDPAYVNKSGGYAASYNKALDIDGITLPPRVGQMISTGVTGATVKLYSAISSVDSSGNSIPSTTSLLLNRGLDAAVANNAVLGLGPAGNYNFAFHRDAIALVSRPLAMPQRSMGVLAAVVEMDGVGLRVTMTYDGKAQGHRVTVDVLCGVKTLDTNLGCLFLSA